MKRIVDKDNRHEEIGTLSAEFYLMPATQINDEFTEDKDEDKILDFKITKLLYRLGIPITSVGFYYFKDAIAICIKDSLAATNAQKNIYMVIADKYAVSYRSVERAMRFDFTEAVAIRATSIFEEELKLFACSGDEGMSLLEFICLLSIFICGQD